MTDRSTAVARTARLLKESGCDEHTADQLARRIADVWQPLGSRHAVGVPTPPAGGVPMPEGFRQAVREAAERPQEESA